MVCDDNVSFFRWAHRSRGRGRGWGWGIFCALCILHRRRKGVVANVTSLNMMNTKSNESDRSDDWEHCGEEQLAPFWQRDVPVFQPGDCRESDEPQHGPCKDQEEGAQWEEGAGNNCRLGDFGGVNRRGNAPIRLKDGVYVHLCSRVAAGCGGDRCGQVLLPRNMTRLRSIFRRGRRGLAGHTRGEGGSKAAVGKGWGWKNRVKEEGIALPCLLCRSSNASRHHQKRLCPQKRGRPPTGAGWCVASKRSLPCC